MIYSKPFKHAVIDDFISAQAVAEINAQWPDDWTKGDGKGSNKWSTQILPPAAQAVVDSIDIAMIEEITGIKGLIADPELFGAGLHHIPRGGFLKMHVDFNAHPKGWHRRVNVLLYLNEVWKDKWQGRLQLGLKGQKQIDPIGGRCVIFETNEKSWHGHPKILVCPEDVSRRSLAVYFYTPEAPEDEHHTTIYRH